MAKAAGRKKPASITEGNAYEFATPAAVAVATDIYTHKIKSQVLCKTDTKGFGTAGNQSPAEIVVDASRGFIPLWNKDSTLRWRFQEQSMAVFQRPEAAKQSIKQLFGEALLLWGDAAPVKFSQRDDAWDFEVVMRSADECKPNGCVLASAFFPDAGRHELTLYPKLFEQNHQEQLETLAHEIGHIFGLRHFFAALSESAWPSEIFGTHKPFSIMNYGDDSFMTDDDRGDLRRLYSAVWSGQLNAINGTPIKLVQPFSAVNANPFVMSMAAAMPEKEACCCCCKNLRSYR